MRLQRKYKMALVRDLSGNGAGVQQNQRGFSTPVDLSSTDATINNANVLYAGGAGNIILRAPNSPADVTYAAIAGILIPIAPGTIVRKTGTTATGLVATTNQGMRG
jgi:hypothetical protein